MKTKFRKFLQILLTQLYIFKKFKQKNTIKQNKTELDISLEKWNTEFKILTWFKLGRPHVQNDLAHIWIICIGAAVLIVSQWKWYNAPFALLSLQLK